MLVFLTGLVLVAATWTGSAATTVQKPVAMPTDDLTVLLTSQRARSRPAARSKPLALVQSRRPLTGVRTVLPVLGRKTLNGRRWLRVRLPGRPNSSTGWIRRRGTFPIRTSWHIVVDTSARRVTAYKHGRSVRTFKAIVGAASTPTPHGEFFIEETIRLPLRAVGSPLAFALSARSNVFQNFAGGPGQIGIHSLRNVGGRLGTAVSHGCIRMDAAAIGWLVARVTPGVRVTIKP